MLHVTAGYLLSCSYRDLVSAADRNHSAKQAQRKKTVLILA